MTADHHHALAPLLSRRSTPLVGDVAPTDDELDAILQAAVTVPDHGALRPWRLVVISDGARAAFGDALAAAGEEANPELAVGILDKLRQKAHAAPTLIAIVARIHARAKVPAWEQVASAACAGYAITLAAHQLGLGAIWKSSPFQEGAALRSVLDMGPDDQFLGWVNLGRPAELSPASPRRPVDLGDIVRVLSRDGHPTRYEVVPA